MEISSNMYDVVEEYNDCTVQILTNSVTGEVSIGWWRNDKRPLGMTEEDTEED